MAKCRDLTNLGGKGEKNCNCVLLLKTPGDSETNKRIYLKQSISLFSVDKPYREE